MLIGRRHIRGTGGIGVDLLLLVEARVRFLATREQTDLKDTGTKLYPQGAGDGPMETPSDMTMLLNQTCRTEPLVRSCSMRLLNPCCAKIYSHPNEQRFSAVVWLGSE